MRMVRDRESGWVPRFRQDDVTTALANDGPAETLEGAYDLIGPQQWNRRHSDRDVDLPYLDCCGPSQFRPDSETVLNRQGDVLQGFFLG